jgi:hypothetical protein
MVANAMQGVKAAADKAVADAVRMMGDMVRETVQAVVQKLQETTQNSPLEAAQTTSDRLRKVVQESVSKAGDKAILDRQQRLEEFDVEAEFNAGSLKARVRGEGHGWQGAPDDPVQDILSEVNKLRGLGGGQ